eukprot:TRINITY_DN8944_c0_g1_i3.p1 TRINITY_DN8944_c0_g1~~TRINITY_DN8944_c0_g1_i3.p1  ORF type:complete len:122 (+),score=45.29 TRINITY_DN8944_c0_g1_i3:81-446(+)
MCIRDRFNTGELKNIMKGTLVGLNKGFVVTRISKKFANYRPSYRKGRKGKRVTTIRNIIREVVGLAPYEKRITELLRTGSLKDGKKAYKLAKRKLGTHRRGLHKREELENLLRAQRKKQNL